MYQMKERESIMNEEIIKNEKIIEIRMALEEIKAEAKQMVTNMSILLEELEKVKTKEDGEKFDDLSDRLTSGYKHLEIF